MKMSVVVFLMGVVMLLGMNGGAPVVAQTSTGPDIGSTEMGIDNGRPSNRGERSTVETGIGGGPGDNSSDRARSVGLNWIWLLPLLAAVPLYYAWKSGDDERLRRYGE